MSESGHPAPGVVAPALPTRAAPPARLGALLGAFALDLLLAFVLLLAAAIVLGLAWFLLTAAGSAPVQPGGAQAPAAAGADPMSILVTLLGMAAAALGLYFQRQPASALERQLPQDEQQQLKAGDETFLALWKPANVGEPTGVVILVPASGESADWPQAIGPLRSKLPDAGFYAGAQTP